MAGRRKIVTRMEHVEEVREHFFGVTLRLVSNKNPVIDSTRCTMNLVHVTVIKRMGTYMAVARRCDTFATLLVPTCANGTHVNAGLPWTQECLA